MSSLSYLSDEQLIAEVKVRAASERQAAAQLIASLAELDARRLYLGEGCASLFAYCTRVLHHGRATRATNVANHGYRTLDHPRPRPLEPHVASDINRRTRLSRQCRLIMMNWSARPWHDGVPMPRGAAAPPAA